MAAKKKLTICKSQGCQSPPEEGLNYCLKHWWPANKPEDRIIIPLLTDTLLKYYQKKDDARANDGLIHISSLNLCMREKVFQHIRPEPLTPRKLKWFTNGNAIHHKLQVLGTEHEEYRTEYEVKKGNIIAHLDLYDTKRNIPFEAKSMEYPREVPRNFHIDQLKMYMALTDADLGVLLYDPLIDHTDEPFAEWTVKMDKSERTKLLEVIENKAALYALAMAKQDPSVATHIAYDPEYNWHCDYCQYYNECMQMRVNDRVQEAVA